MADIFISYARDDQAVARRVAKGLQRAGLDVWWDDNLPAHRAYSEEIERNLATAKGVVVLWSGTAAKSQWVRAEADFARNAGKLVQAQLDGTLPPMPFNQVQCADLQGWRGNPKHRGWAKLKASVDSVLRGEEPPEASSPPAASVPVRWWDMPRARWAAAAVVALVIGALFITWYMSRGERSRPVVAVLPFESLDKRDQGLVSGIWEDTRQALSRNPQLLVLGPNTSEQLAGDANAARRAADFLVEASVRSVGDRIRVSANLVRTDDNAQMWSESFERRLDDVFALQSEIAGEIEGRIRGRLADRGGKLPEHIVTSGEVYALYSDARAKIRKRHFPSYPKAFEQLQQVVKTDPNFAPGWATLSVLHKFAAGSSLIKGTSNESAEAMARRSIALAPNLGAGHAALGFALQEGPAAQASLRRALSLDPNDIEAMNWLANSMDPMTEGPEKLALYSRIVEIEPLWWPAIVNKVSLLFALEGQAGVERELARVESLGNDSLAALIKMDLMAHRGDLSEVVKLGLSQYRRASGQGNELISMTLFQALHQLGHAELADKVFPPPSDYVHYIRTNDPRALDMIEEQHSPEGFWTFGLLPVISARVYLLNGQGPRLAKRYRAVASTPEQFEKVTSKQALPDIAPGVALALRSAGDDEQARGLLKLAEVRSNELRTEPLDKHIRLARIYAVQGRKDEAIGQLSSAVRGGWLPPFLPIHTDIAFDPPLAELKGDPRFEALRQQILRHLAKERAELGPVSLH